MSLGRLYQVDDQGRRTEIALPWLANRVNIHLHFKTLYKVYMELTKNSAENSVVSKKLTLLDPNSYQLQLNVQTLYSFTI